METPTPPPRCLPCGKRIFATQAIALEAALNMRLSNGKYQDEYRCPRSAAGGWHLRDLLKRYEKVKEHGGNECDELREKIKRLGLPLPEDAHNAPRKQTRGDPLAAALRKLPPSGKKPAGRWRRSVQRKRGHHPEGGEARVRGTRGTAVSNELRRRAERARLQEELRKEKDG